MSKKTISGFSSNECYALVIGINYINSPEIKLNGCCTDAYNIKEMLLNRFGFMNDNITHDLAGRYSTGDVLNKGFTKIQRTFFKLNLCFKNFTNACFGHYA